MFELAIENKILRSAIWNVNKLAEIDWLKGFMKQNSY